MKKTFLLSAAIAAVLALGSVNVMAEEAVKNTIVTNDSLLTVTLPGQDWYQLISEENTEMFSDGNCAIIVNLYKNTDTLPAIQTSDANHEMVYTAAASTPQYVLYVVGYAHEVSDFAAICDSINSIKVDSTKITDSMLNHKITESAYAIKETSYAAWVSCSDELNVRSASSTDASIITTLKNGDAVTVTGTILYNNKEIGWARIKTANGTVGYVSTQFLTTKGTAAADSENEQKSEEASEKIGDAYRTGYSITVYDEDGNALIIYQYSDGKYYDYRGHEFTGIAEDAWTIVGYEGTVYYEQNPAVNTKPSATEASQIIYNSEGIKIYITLYTDGKYYDPNGDQYEGISEDAWTCVGTGGTYYEYDPTAGEGPAIDSENALTVYTEDGTPVEIYADSNGRFYDANGFEYTGVSENAWTVIGTGGVYYDYDPTSGTVDDSGYSYDSYQDDSISIYGSDGSHELSSDESGFYYDENGDAYEGIAEDAWINVDTGETYYE